MGEITDLMLEGVLCEECGAFIDDNPESEIVSEPVGYPRQCDYCKDENNG